MSKKFKAAITVAAIAGTCALSSPSFAAWTSDAPNKLAANITAGAVSTDNNEGMMIVGSEGKTYFMDGAKMVGGDPVWTKIAAPATSDFVDAIYDANLKSYWAVTVSGEVVNSSDGRSWTSVSMDAGAKDAIEGRIVTGITSCEGSEGADDRDIIVITTDGVIAHFDKSESLWKASIGPFVTEHIANYRVVTGVTELPEIPGKVVIYGKEGGADGHSNLYVLNLADGSFQGFNVQNCPNINDLSIQSRNAWYAIGDSATVVKGTQDLNFINADDSDINVTTAKTVIKQARR